MTSQALQTTLTFLSIAVSALGLAALFVRTGRRFGALETDLAGFRREVGLQFAAVDSRFDGVDQRFDGIDSRLDRMGDRFDRMDDRFDRMDERFDRMDDRFDKMDSRFDRMDDKFDRMDGRLTSVQLDVVRIGTHLDDHVVDPRAHDTAQA